MSGYYRFPTVFKDEVVFTSEDDLWLVSLNGGLARRLTASRSIFTHAHFSPDGQYLAFTGEEEGSTEIYLMPVTGGVPQRLTFLDSRTYMVGWNHRDNSIIFGSNTSQPFQRMIKLYTIGIEGGMPKELPVGIATHISFAPAKGIVIGRNTTDLSTWKRYRGGLTGDFWIDVNETGRFRRLLKLNGNLTRPMWIGDRIYFISDHEGIGNIYSCNLKGKAIQQHTFHSDFYVRHPSTDGEHIVYHAGADLYKFHLSANITSKIEIKYESSHPQKRRQYIYPGDFFEYYDIHPNGKALALTCRGKPFSMLNWEGGVNQIGEKDGVRYREINWLHDGTRLVMVSDAEQEEYIEVHNLLPPYDFKRFVELDIGRIEYMITSPKEDLVAISNHRMELCLIDLVKGKMLLLDRSSSGIFEGISWSPDGKWIAYSKRVSLHLRALFICEIKTGKIFPVSRTDFSDYSPVFDPDGKYLYFISTRYTNSLQGTCLYLITLKKNTASPFDSPLTTLSEALSTKNEKSESTENLSEAQKEQPEPSKEEEFEIDFDGIENRIIKFPIPNGNYSQINAVSGRVFFTCWYYDSFIEDEEANRWKIILKMYSMEDRKIIQLKSNVNSFKISKDNKNLIYRSENNLRIMAADDKEIKKLEDNSYTKKSGWIDLNRVNVSVVPQEEWFQMYSEAWRLQRDYFWTEDMSGVDWKMIYKRYLPLVNRAGTRNEITDLIYEMQGELGTSHAYVFQTTNSLNQEYYIGFLGADFEYDEKTGGYRIAHVCRGDSWNPHLRSPLAQVGLMIHEGEIISAINNQSLSAIVTPNQSLVFNARKEVFLTLKSGTKKTEPRIVCVKTLASENSLRYREWVEKNRRIVHEATNRRIGYIHIPDMSNNGRIEFERYFNSEIDRDGLIIDVRFNTGGNISEYILAKLAQKRIGYGKRRWGEPVPYPRKSILGPIVAIANEYSASDGDIFSHGFKLLKIGKLVGKRTWGGVIGYYYRGRLVDGGRTTQPESSAWFEDVEWQLENYGTEPDIEVEFRPQDYVKGKDPQLKKSIEIILEELEENPPHLPDFNNRPRLGIDDLIKK